MPCVVLLSAGNPRHSPQRRTGTGTQRLCDVRRTDRDDCTYRHGTLRHPGIRLHRCLLHRSGSLDCRNGLHHGGLLYYHEEGAEEAGRCDYGGVGAEEILRKDSGAASESRILLKDQGGKRRTLTALARYPIGYVSFSILQVCFFVFRS